MNMTQKGFGLIAIIIGIVILLAVGTGVGYLVGKKPVEPGVAPAPSQPKIAEIVQEIPAVKDETADWKIYRNEKYGFELKYPADFEKYTETSVKVFFRQKSNPRVTFNVYVNPYVGFEGYAEYKSSKQVVVDGISSKIGFRKSNDNQLFISTWINQGGNGYKIYTFAYGDEQAIEKLFLSILSTFKFF